MGTSLAGARALDGTGVEPPSGAEPVLIEGTADVRHGHAVLKASRVALLRQVLGWLELKKVFAWRANCGAGRAAGGRSGPTPRAPDVLCVLPPTGRLVGIELKAAGGKLRPAQALVVMAVESGDATLDLRIGTLRVRLSVEGGGAGGRSRRHGGGGKGRGNGGHGDPRFRG